MRLRLASFSELRAIGIVCEITGLTRRAVRYYELIGLVIPTRDGTAQRFYSEGQVATLRTIARLRKAGLGLKDIRQILLTEPAVRQPALTIRVLMARLDYLAQAKDQAEAALREIRLWGLPGLEAAADIDTLRQA